MKDNELRVCYTGGLNQELDKALERVLEKFGYRFQEIGFGLKRKQNRGRVFKGTNHRVNVDIKKLENNYFCGLNEGDTKRQFERGRRKKRD